MNSREDRKFRLGLTIKDEPSEAVTVAIVLGEDQDGVAMLGVIASGFTADDAGAGMLADMLHDAADAIDDHLKRDRGHTPTESIPVVKRPRFNPQPRGGK